MAGILLIGMTERTMNRFMLGSLREAQNLKDFLEQTGEYKRVEIYHVQKAEGPLSELKEIQQVVR